MSFKVKSECTDYVRDVEVPRQRRPQCNEVLLERLEQKNRSSLDLQKLDQVGVWPARRTNCLQIAHEPRFRDHAKELATGPATSHENEDLNGRGWQREPRRQWSGDGSFRGE